jgi:hypothetical protein
MKESLISFKQDPTLKKKRSTVSIDIETARRLKFEELLKKREEAMNDPNNPLYNLRSNYYRNNFHVLTG